MTTLAYIAAVSVIANFILLTRLASERRARLRAESSVTSLTLARNCDRGQLREQHDIIQQQDRTLRLQQAVLRGARHRLRVSGRGQGGPNSSPFVPPGRAQGWCDFDE